MIRRPSNPDPRSAAAAVTPASDAPTMTKVRSTTEASGLDLDLTALLADPVGLDRLRRRTLDDLAGLHGEHASVAFALDRRSLDLAAHRQVAVTVRADVAERVQRRARAGHRDLGALHLERLRRSLLDVAGRARRSSPRAPRRRASTRPARGGRRSEAGPERTRPRPRRLGRAPRSG